jgi:hypothetical protein
MDEKILFDRFHEALEMEPHSGAYERMRFNVTNHVARKPRLAFRMNWAAMAPRVAAVLVAAVLAIALGAAILTATHKFVGNAPAAPDPNFQAYQALTKADYNGFTAADNLSCNFIEDTTCEAAANAYIAADRQWYGDLIAFKTPPRLAALDGMIRAHLTDAIAYNKAIAPNQKSGNKKAFGIAMDGAFYERSWFDPAVFLIDGSYPRVAGSYRDALMLAKQSLVNCVNGTPGPADIACANIGFQCQGVDVQACITYAHTAAAQLQTFLIGLLQNPAPSTLAAKDRELQGELAQADADLLSLTDALQSGDATKAALAEDLFVLAVRAADVDIGVMVSP